LNVFIKLCYIDGVNILNSYTSILLSLSHNKFITMNKLVMRSYKLIMNKLIWVKIMWNVYIVIYI